MRYLLAHHVRQSLKARLSRLGDLIAFTMERFPLALKQLNSALVTQDLQLQERAYYNLGNTEYRLGTETPTPDKKLANWEHAVGSYESALKLNPNDQDAKFNLEVVKKKLEELEKQQQQNKDKNKDQGKDKDKDKQDKDDKKDQSKKDDQSKQDKDKQDKDKQQMRIRLTRQRHAQLLAVREINRRLATRHVLLRKEHLLVWAMSQTP